MVFKLLAYRKAWFPVESVTNYSEIGPPGAKLPCHHILEGKEHCPQSPDPRGLICSLSDCVTYTNNNFFEPRYPQGLRKRVGCTYWIKYNKLEFIDVFPLTCLKLVSLSSQNWDTWHKNLHSQLPLKIAQSDITELASPIATVSCSCRSSCPFSQSLAPILQTAPHTHCPPSQGDHHGVTSLIIYLISWPWRHFVAALGRAVGLLSLLRFNDSNIWSSCQSRKYIPFPYYLKAWAFWATVGVASSGSMLFFLFPFACSVLSLVTMVITIP